MNARHYTLAAVLVAALAVAAVAGVAAPAAASGSTPTYVESNVTDDTTWTPDDGPYFVGGDVTVERGATLTIEPGTTVNVGEEVTVTVRGSLVANGTAVDPVEITTAEPSPSAGTWETIEFDGSGGSTLHLDHAVVEYATTAVTATSSAGTIEVESSTVRDHVETGIAVTAREGAPRIEVRDSRFRSLGRAGIEVTVPETDPYVESVEDIRVSRTVFENTGSYGVIVRARQISDVSVAGGSVSGVDEAGIRFAMESTEARPQSTNDHVATDVTVRNVDVRDAGTEGVSFVGGALDRVTVQDTEVTGVSGAGIAARATTDADDLRLASNTVTDAATGVRVKLRQPTGGLQHVSMTVAANEIRRTSGFGVDVDLSYVVVESLAVRNNTAVGNGDGGIHVGGQVVERTTVADNVVRGNDGPGIEVSALRVKGLAVTRNRVTKNADDGIDVRASNVLSGLAVVDNRVVDNDGVGVDVEHRERGDAANALRENTVVANVDGVRLVGPAEMRVANNTVVLNTAGHERFDGGPATGGTGVVVANASSNVELTHNDVYGHITGLRSSTDGTTVAENNYWGAASGPYHATLNPDGAGDTVLTDRGKADPVPYASEPFGPRLERPTALLDANETTVQPGDAVRFSASRSRDDDTITAFYFSVDGDRVPGASSATYVRTFRETGTYEVSLTVEDSVGVRSLNDASVTIRVQAETTTPTTEPTTTQQGTTASTTTAPTTSSTTEPGDESNDESLVGSLTSLWGGLGGAFYLLAFGLGTYGTWLSMKGQEPPVSGKLIHALAGLGILTWAVAGFLGDGTLLTVAGGGAIAWGGLTGAILALAG